MTVVVQLFARTRELVGQESLSLELPDAATVADLRKQLTLVCPSLGEILPRCMIAVGDEYASDDVVLSPGVETACIPPVSGG